MGQDSSSAWSGEGIQERGDWTIWPLALSTPPSSPHTDTHTHNPTPQASSTPPPSPCIPPVARAPDGNPPQCSSSFHVLISSPAPRLHVAPTSLGLGCFCSHPLPYLPHPLPHPYTYPLHPPPSSTTTKGLGCGMGRLEKGGKKKKKRRESGLKGGKRGQIKHCSISVKQPAFYRDRNKQERMEREITGKKICPWGLQRILWKLSECDTRSKSTVKDLFRICL